MIVSDNVHEATAQMIDYLNNREEFWKQIDWKYFLFINCPITVSVYDLELSLFSPVTTTTIITLLPLWHLSMEYLPKAIFNKQNLLSLWPKKSISYIKNHTRPPRQLDPEHSGKGNMSGTMDIDVVNSRTPSFPVGQPWIFSDIVLNCKSTKNASHLPSAGGLLWANHVNEPTIKKSYNFYLTLL